MIASVNRAMGEQTTAVQQVSAAMNAMRRESEQAARALAEQTRGLKDMTSATQSTSAQIRLITTANRTHSTAAGRVLEQLRDIRKITDRNARDVHETRGNTAELVRHAEDLAGLAAAGTALAHGKSNGVNGRG
jgi:methyl-accepting chemotaxis protein